LKAQRRGQLAGLAAAVLFGCSAPLISTFTGAGSPLSIAGLLCGGATLSLLGGVVGSVALVLGLARLPAASSSLLLNLEAVFILAIAMLLEREQFGRSGLLAAGFTIAGAVMLSEGSFSGANGVVSALIALATLA
jgi:drug/metabolite transporter (DMT)-like permease